MISKEAVLVICGEPRFSNPARDVMVLGEERERALRSFRDGDGFGFTFWSPSLSGYRRVRKASEVRW